MALELRDAVVSAVCARNFDLLPGLVQRLARLSPTEDVLRGSGIGHLVGDRHIWGLAGFTTQRRAAALQARWRLAIRQSRSSGTATPYGSPETFCWSGGKGVPHAGQRDGEDPLEVPP